MITLSPLVLIGLLLLIGALAFSVVICMWRWCVERQRRMDALWYDAEDQAYHELGCALVQCVYCEEFTNNYVELIVDRDLAEPMCLTCQYRHGIRDDYGEITPQYTYLVQFPTA